MGINRLLTNHYADRGHQHFGQKHQPLLKFSPAAPRAFASDVGLDDVEVSLSSPEELANRLGAFDTCTVSDAMDALRLRGALSGIGPVWPCDRIAGQVSTVRLANASEHEGISPRHLGTTAISRAVPGEVIVVDNRAGRGESGGWGGLLALAARLKAVAGVIVYGAVRDIDDVAEVGLPLYAHSVTPRTARGRTVEVANGEPLEFDEVVVSPGDFVVADRSGVVFIAKSEMEKVLKKAQEISDRENQMVAHLHAGRDVTDVMAGNYENMLVSEE